MFNRPMKAAELKNIEELRFPVIATPKVDGIRCLKPDNRVLAASFKPIPNDYIRNILERYLPKGADGEICTSSEFSQVSSDVMSKGGKPDFIFWMFDYVKYGELSIPYSTRLSNMLEWFYMKGNQHINRHIKALPFKFISCVDELRDYEKGVLAQGYEGVVVRDPEGPYKCGYSTWKEQWMVKWKRFVDSEAVILGFQEQLSNQNKLEKNELGMAKRSGKKSGKVPTGRLGKFLARDIHNGLEFKCGTGKGLTLKLREEIWNNQPEYIGKIFKYKYQPHGVKKLPRIPIWLGFRDPIDITSKE